MLNGNLASGRHPIAADPLPRSTIPSKVRPKFRRNSRVTANHDKLCSTDRLGRKKNWPLAEIARSDRFSESSRRSRSLRYLVFVQQDGRKAFAAADSHWDFNRLVRS